MNIRAEIFTWSACYQRNRKIDKRRVKHNLFGGGATIGKLGWSEGYRSDKHVSIHLCTSFKFWQILLTYYFFRLIDCNRLLASKLAARTKSEMTCCVSTTPVHGTSPVLRRTQRRSASWTSSAETCIQPSNDELPDVLWLTTWQFRTVREGYLCWFSLTALHTFTMLFVIIFSAGRYSAISNGGSVLSVHLSVRLLMHAYRPKRFKISKCFAP